MNLYLILDLNQENWTFLSSPDIFINNIIVFVNLFEKLAYENRVFLINNKKILYDTKKNSFSDFIIAFNNSKNSCSQDIGYSLSLANKNKESTRIFALDLNEEEKNINVLKCSFVSEKMKIKIDGFGPKENENLKRACYSTGGSFCDDENLFFKFLMDSLNPNKKIEQLHFGVECLCHGQEILYGLVCPICLAVYCKFVPICKRCKTKINFSK
ncbi:RNA polymerase II transcription factor B subunit 4 [Gurleya vavrai]